MQPRLFCRRKCARRFQPRGAAGYGMLRKGIFADKWDRALKKTSAAKSEVPDGRPIIWAAPQRRGRPMYGRTVRERKRPVALIELSARCFGRAGKASLSQFAVLGTAQRFGCAGKAARTAYRRGEIRQQFKEQGGFARRSAGFPENFTHGVARGLPGIGVLVVVGDQRFPQRPAARPGKRGARPPRNTSMPSRSRRRGRRCRGCRSR